MSKLIRVARCALAFVAMFVGGITCSHAQSSFTAEDLSFDSQALRGGGATVYGTLRIPETGSGKLPVVLVLHSSAGANRDHHSDAFIDVLNKAGIATLWISMFPQTRPRSTREVLPLTYGSLLYLAKNPRIDPTRIGVMGFSYGGVVSMIMSSQEVTREYAGDKARFAAHLALYPVCWAHQQILAGSNAVYGAGTYRHVTGAPVHILAGEKDDYDEPDSCPKFVASLPEGVREHYAATVYPGAAHSFDWPGSNSQYYDQYAHLGRGGTVRLDYDASAAAQSLAFAVEFFQKHLAAKK